jgi:hypothetical protein
VTASSAPLEWLVKGYRRALARFDATADQREQVERFIPLFEALNWAVTIAEFLSKRGCGVDDDTIRGLQFARNRVHHQWADALEAQDVPNPVIVSPVGGRSRVVMPPTRVDWFWKPLDQLPAVPPRFSDPECARLYSAHLAGQSARDALAQLDDLLRRLGH